MRNEIALLTPAELKVLLLIGKGLKNGEAAKQLGRAKETIRSHIKNLYRKLDTFKRLQLVLYAIDFVENDSQFDSRQMFVDEKMEVERIKLSIEDRRGKHQKGYVYFVLDRANDGVKIGWSLNLKRRLETMQGISFNKLELIFSTKGTLIDECRFHKRFKKYNIHHEWFRYSSEIKTYIEQQG